MLNYNRIFNKYYILYIIRFFKISISLEKSNLFTPLLFNAENKALINIINKIKRKII